MVLGNCKIVGGKHSRNCFVYFENSKTVYIDFDSDYSLSLKINLKNPKKALIKAEKIVENFKNKTVTVDDLRLAGFKDNIPQRLL